MLRIRETVTPGHGVVIGDVRYLETVMKRFEK